MTNILGPFGAGIRETTTRPASAVSGSGTDSWFAPCTTGDDTTGTYVAADWLNKVTAQLRRGIRGMGVTESETDDDMLLKAIKAAGFPQGTACLFVQTAAPTGWTKVTTHNDKALRVVSGTASSGGTAAFTTAFASRTPTGTNAGTALSVGQLPAHEHFIAAAVDAHATLTGSNQLAQKDSNNSGTTANQYDLQGSATAATLGKTSSVGSGQTHTHSFTGDAMDFAVAYVDVIIATKD